MIVCQAYIMFHIIENKYFIYILDIYMFYIFIFNDTVKFSCIESVGVYSLSMAGKPTRMTTPD